MLYSLSKKSANKTTGNKHHIIYYYNTLIDSNNFRSLTYLYFYKDINVKSKTQALPLDYI